MQRRYKNTYLVNVHIPVKLQILLIEFVLQHTPKPVNRTKDYYYPFDDPASNSWKGNFNFKEGLTKAFPFYIRKTIETKNQQQGYFSIKDETWEEKYVNEENFTYLETLRNISGSAMIFNGNYSSNQYTSISYKGIYYPQQYRGYGTFEYKLSGFKEHKYETNESIDDLVNQTEWPPIIDTYLTDDDINNYQTKTHCPGYVYFQLQKVEVQQPPKTLQDVYYRIYNDTFQEDDKYYQYKLNYTVISRDCAFLFQSEIMDIYNENEQTLQYAYFYAIYLPLCIISCIFQMMFIFKSNLVFVQDFPLAVLILWSNASYLYIVGLICYSTQINFTIRNTILCVILQLISLLSPTLKLALKGLENHDNDTTCKKICILLGYVLSGMVIGFAIIVCCFFFNIIQVVFPLCCIIMCYIPVYSIIILLNNQTWQKPLLPITFLIGENGIKLVFLFYVFCYKDNFGNIETNILCLIALGILAIFYMIYIIQLFTGAKFGKIPETAKKETYVYSGHLLPESELKQFKQVSAYQGLKVPFQPDKWDECKICKNLTHIHHSSLNNQQSQRQSQSDCFTYIDPNSYQIICPICLCQIDLKEYIEDCNDSFLQDSEYVLKGTVKNDEQQKLRKTENKQLTKTTLYITPCKHCFHRECLNTWLQQHRECPSCRSPLLPSLQ